MTTLDRAVRLEDLADRPTSRISEASLLQGYSAVEGEGQLVARRCACGGRIQTYEAPKSIRYAVDLHNETADHVAWALAAGLREEGG